MTVQVAQEPLPLPPKPNPIFDSWVQWFASLHINFELGLAAITLIALLIGWIGGSVANLLSPPGVLIMAIIAYVAGGYAGLTGAIAEARKGKLDIEDRKSVV